MATAKMFKSDVVSERVEGKGVATVGYDSDNPKVKVIT